MFYFQGSGNNYFRLPRKIHATKPSVHGKCLVNFVSVDFSNGVYECFTRKTVIIFTTEFLYLKTTTLPPVLDGIQKVDPRAGPGGAEPGGAEPGGGGCVGVLRGGAGRSWRRELPTDMCSWRLMAWHGTARHGGVENENFLV